MPTAAGDALTDRSIPRQDAADDPATIVARPDDDGFARRPDPDILPLPGVARRRGRGASAGRAGRADEFGPRDILNALRYHSVLFVTLGTLVAGGLGAAAWLLVPAKYTTYAMILVARRATRTILPSTGGDDRAGRVRHLPQDAGEHDQESRTMIAGACATPKIARTPMLRDEEDPIELPRREDHHRVLRHQPSAQGHADRRGPGRDRARS